MCLTIVPPICFTGTPQSVQQQIVHQQIVQQLRTAVQAGLINPQLLNQQLTPAMLVTLQQLLQLQTVLQRLIQQEQVLKQNKQLSNTTRHQQLDQLNQLITRTRHQIFQSQNQISAAQQSLPKPSGVLDAAATTKDIGVGLAQLSIQAAQKKELNAAALQAQQLAAVAAQAQQLKQAHQLNPATGMFLGGKLVTIYKEHHSLNEVHGC